MKKLLTLILLCAAFTISAQLLNPTSEFKAGDFVADSVMVTDADGKQELLQFPDAKCHQVIFRFSWKDIGRGADTRDSLIELQRRVKKIMKERGFGCTRVICVSYDRGSEFIRWQQLIKTEPLMPADSSVTVNYYNTAGNTSSELMLKRLLSKVTLIAPSGRILRYASLISRFDYSKAGLMKTIFKGKLIGEMDGSSNPLTNAKVALTTPFERDTVAYAFTNSSGEFELQFHGSEADYHMHVQPSEQQQKANIILTTQDGRTISTLKKSSEGFTYRLLKQDVVLLSEIKEEDVTLKFESFVKSSKTEMLTSEDIFYESGSALIREESKAVLDKVVEKLNKHTAVKLQIISHTDAIGNENDNQSLSEKRAASVVAYLSQKGIDASRLSSTGKGESQIRNRCGNGVNCTDKEHAYNRRTEFLFSKP